MPIPITDYICSICGSRFESYSTALECENKGITKPRFKSREIVTAKFLKNLSFYRTKLVSVPAEILEVSLENFTGIAHHYPAYKIYIEDDTKLPMENRNIYYGYDHKDTKARILLYKRKGEVRTNV